MTCLLRGHSCRFQMASLLQVMNQMHWKYWKRKKEGNTVYLRYNVLCKDIARAHLNVQINMNFINVHTGNAFPKRTSTHWGVCCCTSSKSQSKLPWNHSKIASSLAIHCWFEITLEIIAHYKSHNVKSPKPLYLYYYYTLVFHFVRLFHLFMHVFQLLSPLKKKLFQVHTISMNVVFHQTCNINCRQESCLNNGILCFCRWTLAMNPPS